MNRPGTVVAACTLALAVALRRHVARWLTRATGTWIGQP